MRTNPQMNHLNALPILTHESQVTAMHPTGSYSLNILSRGSSRQEDLAAAGDLRSASLS